MLTPLPVACETALALLEGRDPKAAYDGGFDNSVALGANSNDGGRANVVSVGSVNAERQLTNVAAGTQGTDAVNVNQLTQSATGTLQQANSYTDSKVAGMQNNINSVQNQLNDVAKKAYAGVASALAMEAAPYVPGKTTFAAGTGHYQSQGALAISLRRTADNGRWSVSAGVAASTNGVGLRAGVSGVWD